jgi:hypothetical protein
MFLCKDEVILRLRDTNSRNKLFPVDSSVHAPDGSQLFVRRLGAVSCKTRSLYLPTYLALQLPDAQGLCLVTQTLANVIAIWHQCLCAIRTDQIIFDSP